LGNIAGTKYFEDEPFGVFTEFDDSNRYHETCFSHGRQNRRIHNDSY
jgi:hypothetical protein